MRRDPRSARLTILAMLGLIALSLGLGAVIARRAGERTAPGALPANSTTAADDGAPSTVAERRARSEVEPTSQSTRTSSPRDSGGDTSCATVDASLDAGEGFAAAAAAQLKALAHLLAATDNLDAPQLAAIAEESLALTPLRPTPLREVFRDGPLRVVRQEARAETGAAPRAAIAGDSASRDDLAAALRTLSAPMAAGTLHAKFKIFQIETAADTITTTAYYHAHGHAAQGDADRDSAHGDGLVEQSAVWRCRWRLPEPNGAPRLTAVEVGQFEEVTLTAPRDATPAGPGNTTPAGPLLVDVTRPLLAAAPDVAAQLAPGIDHWRRRLPGGVPIDFRGHHGLALADVDGDGLEDIYLCQPNGLPNRLLIRQPDGTLVDRAAEAGVDWLDATIAALLIDADNDGDADLVLGMHGRVLVMENDGRGNFALRRELPGPEWPHSLAAADVEGDGDLDLYVCAFWQFYGSEMGQLVAALNIPTPYHDANNGPPNLLLRNDGELRFVDATQASGLDENNRRFSHAASFEDFDDDGDQDLYVANDFGRNNFYRNDGGKFVDVAPQAGVEDMAAGMSVAWGDYDRDGRIDLYVSNMFSSAGGRITGHEKFQPRLDETVKDDFRRHARGNSLFRNLGDGSFDDVSVPAAVTLGRWAWSSNFTDLNNDGWEDLLVANGFMTNEDTGDL